MVAQGPKRILLSVQPETEERINQIAGGQDKNTLVKSLLLLSLGESPPSDILPVQRKAATYEVELSEDEYSRFIERKNQSSYEKDSDFAEILVLAGLRIRDRNGGGEGN